MDIDKGKHRGTDFLLFVVFETGFSGVALAVLEELGDLPAPPPECWD